MGFGAHVLRCLDIIVDAHYKGNLHFGKERGLPKVSLLGVDSLWGDCMFIPADWGS